MGRDIGVEREGGRERKRDRKVERGERETARERERERAYVATGYGVRQHRK